MNETSALLLLRALSTWRDSACVLVLVRCVDDGGSQVVAVCTRMSCTVVEVLE